MQFPVGAITEVTAPNNVPFVPGQNVTGIGAGVPPELIAAGIPNAIIFYSSDWDPNAVVPTAKFKWIAAVGGALVSGYGYCQNPSISQVATIVSASVVGINVVGTIQSPITQINFDTGAGMAYWEQQFDVNKQSYHAFLNRAGQFVYDVSHNGTNHIINLQNLTQLTLNAGSNVFWSSQSVQAMGTINRGRVGQNIRTTNLASLSNGPGVADRVLSTIAPILSTNAYLIRFKSAFFHSAANATIGITLRYTTDNTEPTVTSASCGQGLLLLGAAGTGGTMEMTRTIAPAVTTDTFRVAATFWNTIGATATLQADAATPCELSIEDTGKILANTGTVY